MRSDQVIFEHKFLPPFLILLALGAFPATSLAGETGFPRLEGKLAIELENDGSYESDEPDNEHNQLFIKLDPEATFRLTPDFSIFAHAVLQPVRDQEPGESRAFVQDPVVHLETESESTVGGFRGLGEGGTIGAPAAIANAIADALAPLDIEINELPATPERLFRLIEAARN